MTRMLAALLSAAIPLAAAAPALADVKNPDTYTYLTISDSDSLDPAWSYDTASHNIILNLYEPLFFFDGASTEKLVPRVAEKVPSKANGLITDGGRTYRIPIRKDIQFHDGSPLSPEDVRYSIIRFMLLDRDAGPSEILLQPLLGYSRTRDDKGNIVPNAYADAAKAVSVEGDSVVLRLPKPFAPILSILASWAPALSKSYSAGHGDWDGSEATWKKFNNPNKEASPYFEGANGSGPFKLERWDRQTKQVVLVRNDSYWRGPARLKRVVIKGINEFGTRKLMLQAGDADAIYADRSVYSQVTDIPGTKIIDDLPTMEMNPVLFFNFKINAAGNPNIGSGKLDGDGIPADFFADVDVRKGFAYAFDYAGFIRDVFMGKGTQATGAIPRSLPGNNPKQKPYAFDLGKAQSHFQKAWGGQVWEKGFKFTLTYNSGNVPRQNLCQILKRTVESVSPKFQVDVRPVEWPTFLDAQKNRKLPLFTLGWNADYPDPHNFVFPLLHSEGNYPDIQTYKNPEIDRLVNEAMTETDLAKRKDLYARVQALENEDVPHLVLLDAVRYRTQRDWVQGWYHNPIFPDSPYGSYYYTIWKGEPKGGAGKGGR